MKKLKQKEISEELHIVFQELREDPFRTFNQAFALMSIIPLLVFFYILVTELFGVEILIGRIGLILAATIFITLVGYYASYVTIRNILGRILYYAAAAKQSDQLKSDFVATVSHELKNPITIIKSNLFNMINGFVGTVDEQQKKILDMCYDILQNMSRLVMGLLDIYKIESGVTGGERQECDITGMVKKQLQEFERLLEEKKLNLINKIPDREFKAWLDKDKIERVFYNIINNAIKYTPSEGTITVSLSSSEGFIRFECEDTGPGIAEDRIHKIFDKFERLDRAREGTGLGLAITKDLVELHKGKIWAESQVGQGSKFIVVLPCSLRKEEREEG